MKYDGEKVYSDIYIGGFPINESILDDNSQQIGVIEYKAGKDVLIIFNQLSSW